MARPRSLAAALVTSLTLVTFGLGILIMGSWALLRHAEETDFVTTSLRSRSEILYGPLNTALWNYQPEFLKSIADGLRTDPLVTRILLTDHNGKVLLAWNTASVAPPGGKGPTELPDQDAIVIQTTIVRSIPDQADRIIGYLELGTTRKVVMDRVIRNLLPGFLFVLAMQVVVLVSLLLLLRSIVIRPLVSFSTLLGSLSGTNNRLPPPDPAWRSIEIHSLYRSFRLLMEEVADRQRALEEARDNLENKVIERTRDLELARDQAVSAMQVKNQFLANMSHEIRTPMSAILGFSHLLKDMDLRPEERSFVDKIHRSAASLLDIINDILDVSKIEAGRMELEEIPFDVTVLVQEIKELFELRASGKGLDLRLETRGPRPPMVLGDRLRISQILTNLVGNAVKFTSAGSVLVELDANTDGDGVNGGWNFRFAVTDTGPGITPDQEARIFTAFTQGDSSVTREFGGTGLGLSISRDLARLMGGNIELFHPSGGGSQFVFSIRLGEARESSPSPAPQGDQPLLPVHPGLRILVVEDNQINQTLARAILGRMKIETTMAANGKEALERMAAAEEYDMIFMDLQMPVMGGAEARTRIRALPGLKRIPIIALTAHAMEGTREEVMAQGFDDYLTKPFDFAELGRVISRWAPQLH